MCDLRIAACVGYRSRWPTAGPNASKYTKTTARGWDPVRYDRPDRNIKIIGEPFRYSPRVLSPTSRWLDACLSLQLKLDDKNIHVRPAIEPPGQLNSAQFHF